MEQNPAGGLLVVAKQLLDHATFGVVAFRSNFERAGKSPPPSMQLPSGGRPGAMETACDRRRRRGSYATRWASFPSSLRNPFTASEWTIRVTGRPATHHE